MTVWVIKHLLIGSSLYFKTRLKLSKLRLLTLYLNLIEYLQKQSCVQNYIDFRSRCFLNVNNVDGKNYRRTYSAVFPHLWTASAFKGAFGERLFMPNLHRHYRYFLLLAFSLDIIISCLCVFGDFSRHLSDSDLLCLNCCHRR